MTAIHLRIKFLEVVQCMTPIFIFVKMKGFYYSRALTFKDSISCHARTEAIRILDIHFWELIFTLTIMIILTLQCFENCFIEQDKGSFDASNNISVSFPTAEKTKSLMGLSFIWSLFNVVCMYFEFIIKFQL